MWTVTNERQNASPLLGFLPLFSSMARDIGKHLAADLNLEFLVEFSNRHVRMAAVVSEWERAGILTVRRLESPEFADWIVDGLVCETKNLNELGSILYSTDFSRLPTHELAAEVTKAINALHRFIVYNNFINASDFYHDILTKRILEFLRTSLGQEAAITAEAAYSALTTPDKLVWIQEEEVDLIEILMLVQADPKLTPLVRSDHSGESIQSLNDDLRSALERHTQRYFWIQYEQEGETLTYVHFYNALVQMLAEGIDAKEALRHARERRARVREQFETARSSVTLDSEAEHLLAVARRLVYWKLHLREVKVRFYCCAENLLKEAARRLDLNRHQVRHLTVQELTDALCGSIQLDVASLYRRITYCVFHFTAGQTLLYEGQRARDVFSIVKDETIAIAAKDVKGTCAYPGVTEGLVKQVLQVEDVDHFRRGSVLVAYMTDVGVVRAMRKASAIVTDVGGVTCHASIIAREFGIPCVIGTKIATKVLLDGYRVKVNADAGVVTILSREGYPVQSEQPDLADDREEMLGQDFEIPTTRSTPAPSERVKSLGRLTLGDVRIAGGKGASLGELLRLNLPIPQGFVILTSTFEELVFGTVLGLQINELLRGICDGQSLRQNSQAIQQLIVNAEVPSGIASEIHAAFVGLSSTYVAVRSSATLEDSITASWAGQLETLLNTTSQDLLVNVRLCWASIFSDRAISYRVHCGLTSGHLSTAVIIQKMVESRISGTAFSVHPVSGKDSSVLIESCVGLGETLVLGKETPTTYVVEKDTLKVSYKGINQQRTGLRRAEHGGGNESFSLSLYGSSANVLSDDEARELASLVISIEKKFGFPVDVEWAYEGAKLYLLQSRPITALVNRTRM